MAHGKGKGKELLSFPPEQYTVGWICAISNELKAASAMLDIIHADLRFQPKHDSNTYTLGSIGSHNVVIACLPEYGGNTAAVAATSLLRTFPHTRFGLMVGIGGGVPSQKHDIRLGDIVVSLPTDQGAGVIQYDLGREEVDGFARIGTLNKPPILLRTAIMKMKAKQGVGKEIAEMVNEAFGDEDEDDLDDVWTYPMTSQGESPGITDTLFEADYEHINKGLSCDACSNSSKIVPRTPRKTKNPRIFYGNIASGNAVMKNGVKRDTLAKRDNVICFEMEAAGLMDGFPCLVIRGICDYADSHKNWNWQPYAAAVAAAYAKVLLSIVTPEAVSGLDPIRTNQHWMIPRQVNPNFTGRTEELRIIRSHLCGDPQGSNGAEQRRHIIYGMGGSGKSEVCLKFAHDNRESFWGIFWIDAQSEESLRRSVADAAKIETKKDNMAYDEAKLWFENLDKSWLLIMDNADNAEMDYFKFFPSGHRGCILMTTRNIHFQDYSTAGKQHFEKLSFEESVMLLLKSAGIPEEEWIQNRRDAQNMIGDEVLSQHALAITQAGAFINQGLCTLKEYPSMFQKQRDLLLTDRRALVDPTYGDVYATFEVSAMAMARSRKQEWADALRLLEVLAFLHRENVTEELFTKAWNFARICDEYNVMDDIEWPSSWHTTNMRKLLRQSKIAEELDLVALRKARGTLQSFSLVTLNSTNTGISMHPLVHAWAHDRLDKDTQTAAWATTASILTLSIDSFEYQDFLNTIQSHIEFCIGLRQENFFISDEYSVIEIFRIFYRFTYALYQLTSDKQAGYIAGLLFSRIGHEIMPESENWRSTCYLYAKCQSDLAEHQKAMELLEDIVKFDEAKIIENADRLGARHALAVEYNRLGHHVKALELLVDVVQIQEKTLEATHPELLTSQHSLASIYVSLKQPQKAIEIFEKLVFAEKDVLAPSHPDRLGSEHELARAYLNDGQLEKAIELFKEVVRIQQDVLAPSHPDRLRSEHELARAHLNDGQLEKAIELYKEVVRIRQDVLAPSHPGRLRSEHELARAYLDDRQLEKAIELFKEVVQIQQDVLAPSHPDRLRSEHSLARAYLDDGQLEKAIELFKEVVRIQQDVLAPSHPDRLSSQHSLARAYLDDGQLEKAIELFKEVVRIQQDVLAPSHPDRLLSEHELARAYFSYGCYKRALLLIKGVVRTEADILESNDNSRIVSEELLSNCISALKENKSLRDVSNSSQEETNSSYYKRVKF